MKRKYKILVVLAVMAVLSGAVLRSRPISAQEPFGPESLIQRLVERFGLDQGEVEEVFSQHREEKMSQRQARFEERIDQAVEGGRLTQAQKEAILAKKEELKQACSSVEGLSWEERARLREEHQQEMEQWAQDNGLSLPELFGLGFGPGGPRVSRFGGK